MTEPGRPPEFGAIYDGTGTLIAGDGPAFSVGLVAALPFQALLHDLDRPGNSMEADDRLWLLPDQPWASVNLPEHLLAGLATTVRSGGKVLVMAHDAEAGDLACQSVEVMLDGSHGTA
ncbi:hypothetical protein [Roseomonas sp. BN140053]|uniref:hypothetical protein n=1 Tax=Roseomonas sp. BN140053 TaxID=3391898 RepID=UPI0039E733CA